MERPDKKDFYELKSVSSGHGIGHFCTTKRVFKKISFQRANKKYIDHIESQLKEERENLEQVKNNCNIIYIDGKGDLTFNESQKLWTELTSKQTK